MTQTQIIVSTWLPIEQAPKDRRILLFILKPKPYENSIVMGEWDLDKHAKRPRPYWTNDRESIWGKIHTRNHPPTYYMEIGEPSS